MEGRGERERARKKRKSERARGGSRRESKGERGRGGEKRREERREENLISTS
jgi:hypothetical protein